MLCMHARLQWLGIGDCAGTPPAPLPHAVGSLYLFDSVLTKDFTKDGKKWWRRTPMTLPAGTCEPGMVPPAQHQDGIPQNMLPDHLLFLLACLPAADAAVEGITESENRQGEHRLRVGIVSCLVPCGLTSAVK